MNFAICNLCQAPTLEGVEEFLYIDGSIEHTEYIECALCNHTLWSRSQRIH